MAKPDLGSKHQCQNCSTKFFDLNKDPIVCPKCGTTFQVATATAAPSRVSRATAKRDEDEDAETENEDGAEVVSLEDADQVDDGKVEAASTDDDDVDTDDDDSSNNNDDDTFLEEEEDDGDVSDLVDSDREDDDER